MLSPEEIRRTFVEVPANRYLGFQLVSQTADVAIVAMEIAPHHIQETGVVHGGFLSAVADTASVYVLRPYLGADRSVASIEFKMNFLRPTTLGAGAVVARAPLLRRGRRVGVCEAEVTQGDVVIGKGIFTYLFLDKK